jgi:hypothetical protein
VVIGLEPAFAQIGGSARVLQNFSITQRDPVCELTGTGQSRTIPASPERQGARPGGVRASVQDRPRSP